LLGRSVVPLQFFYSSVEVLSHAATCTGSLAISSKLRLSPCRTA
jgi:hypothetical protein